VNTVPVNQWEGEDEEEEEVLDSWDAEPEEKPKKSASTIAPPEKQKNATKRALQKKEEEERKLAEKLAAQQLKDPNFAAAERERLRLLEEARDAALAGDLFGAEAIKPKDASSDLPGSSSAAAAAAPASSSSSSSAVAASVDATAVPSHASSLLPSNAALAGGPRLDELPLTTDADVQSSIKILSRRLEKLGKSNLASKKILKLLWGVTEECVKVGVLRMDEVAEIKRLATVKHNELTAKQKKADKKGNKKTENKPTVTLARNAFMHGDDFGGQVDDPTDDYDFI